MGEGERKMWVAKLLLAVAILSLATIQAARPKNYRQDFVDAHNVARAQVGVGPIVWNETVAAYARRYAQSRYFDCKLEHSRGPYGEPYGENLAEGYDELSGGDAVRLWVAEKKNYDYVSNSCVGGECLHYTQVVWRKSVHLGCASVKCRNGWVFVTCNYEPLGNYIPEERPY